MNIGYLNGYWSTNVGNAFFQLGAQKFLKKCFPDDEVFPVSDIQGYVYPRKVEENSAILSDIYKLDKLFVLGPFFRPEVISLMLPTLKAFKAKGVKIYGLSVGFMDYSMSSKIIDEVIQSNIFEYFFTRDLEACKILSNHTKTVTNGIDTAFYVNEVLPKNSIDHSSDRVVLTFDQYLEPRCTVGRDISAINLDFHNTQVHLDKTDFAKENIAANIIKRSFLYFNSKKQSSWERCLPDFEIVRTDHRFNPYIHRKIYYRKNTFSSDTPEGYLSLYASSQFTVSNRVHACAAALSFGNKAFLASQNKRGGLLENIGAASIRNEFVDGKTLGLDQQKGDFVSRFKEIVLC